MNNKFEEAGNGKSVAELVGDGPTAIQIGSAVQAYFPDKIMTHVARGNISGFDMITVLLKSKKAKNPFALKQGYHLCYSFCPEMPGMAEGGDCLVAKRGNEYYRIG